MISWWTHLLAIEATYSGLIFFNFGVIIIVICSHHKALLKCYGMSNISVVTAKLRYTKIIFIFQKLEVIHLHMLSLLRKLTLTVIERLAS